MSADKRKVSTDALETLGNIITENEKRDAIHLAVIPVVAAERVFAGQDIGLNEKGEGSAAFAKELLGIVDPFLKTPVQPGQWFWLVIYPRKITSLRHVWTHPAFADDVAAVKPETSAVSKAFIENFASDAGLTYNEIIRAAHDRIDSGEYLVDGGRWEGFYTPPEFWPHFENVTGRKIPEEDRNNFFSCSC